MKNIDFVLNTNFDIEIDRAENHEESEGDMGKERRLSYFNELLQNEIL